VQPTPDDVAFVNAAITDPSQPVVIFSLEWCEFCWAVRRMFARHGIPYRAIDLDAVQYQPENRGGKLRAALTARTSVPTIPQVFVGGELLGGATETFDAYRSGRLQELLATSSVTYDTTLTMDPYSFLPTWLHPR
jgi:cysteine synthase A